MSKKELKSSQASEAEQKKDLKNPIDDRLARLGFDPEAMMASITAKVNKPVKDQLKAKGLIQEVGSDDDGSKYRDTPEVIQVHEVPGKGFISPKLVDFEPLVPQFTCLFVDLSRSSCHTNSNMVRWLTAASRLWRMSPM